MDYSAEYSKILTEMCNEFELEKINNIDTDNNNINIYDFNNYTNELILDIPITFGDFSFIPLKQRVLLNIAFNTTINNE